MPSTPNLLDPLVADEINSYISQLDVVRLTLMDLQSKVRHIPHGRLTLEQSGKVTKANSWIRGSHVNLEQAIQELQRVTP